MISDYPSAYEGQPGFDFLKIVPTWWDETRVLTGKTGRIIVTARRKGKTWYLGGMGAKEAQSLEVALSFLGKGTYTAKVWKDSPETEEDPNRLTTETFTSQSGAPFKVRLSVDGGFVAQFTPARR